MGPPILFFLLPASIDTHVSLLHPALLIPTFAVTKGVLCHGQPNTDLIQHHCWKPIILSFLSPLLLPFCYCLVSDQGLLKLWVNCLIHPAETEHCPLSHTFLPGAANCSNTQCGCSAHITLCDTWTRENTERSSGDGSVVLSELDGSPTLQPEVCTWPRVPCPCCSGAAPDLHGAWPCKDLWRLSFQ